MRKANKNKKMMNMNNNIELMFENNITLEDQMLNYLNEFDNMQLNESNNFITIRLIYQDEFIENVNINVSDDFSSISKKFKSILYKHGKFTYRRPFQDEIIKREFPYETLEFLIERGIIEENPTIIFYRKNNKHIRYPYYSFNINNIINGDEIEVEYDSKIYGSGAMTLEFIDVDENTKVKKLKFSKNAPDWRKATIGLNLFGKCINKKCKAFDKEVIYPVGINKKFDFYSDKKNIICPICSKNFLPLTMGFWKCEYQIKGEKLKGGDYEEIDICGKETKGDNFEYYDPNSNDTAFWSNLLIFTGYRQKMKYRKNTI